jgi:hypothetical protein
MKLRRSARPSSQWPQWAVYVGQSKNVWLDRCDAANRSSKPILSDNSNI